MIKATAEHSRRFLLVDDDAMVRSIARRILARPGVELLEAADAASALALAEADPGALDLLITDVVMPGGGGTELAALLRASRPGLPVLYISGYGADVVARAGPEEAGDFLQKPFTPTTLREGVERALVRGRGR